LAVRAEAHTDLRYTTAFGLLSDTTRIQSPRRRFVCCDFRLFRL